MSTLRYIQVVSGQLTIERLPDGSTAILDQRSRQVHSLNPTAAIAWEACQGGATLAEVRKALETKLNAAVDEAIARDAIAQLRKVDLVQPETAAGAPASVPVHEDLQTAARRNSLLRAAAVALPVVLTLAFSQQRAHAGTASSTPQVVAIFHS